MGRSVVLGIGNVLLSDDGAGVRAAESLAARLPRRSDVEVLDGGTLSFTLLEFLRGARSLIVLDAAELGAPPGSVHCFESGSMDEFLSDASRQRSVHEVGLSDVLAMARLEETLPARRALICIQAAQVRWGLTLSPPVDAGVARAADRAAQLLAGWDA